jgi:hypothetical protein
MEEPTRSRPRNITPSPVSNQCGLAPLISMTRDNLSTGPIQETQDAYFVEIDLPDVVSIRCRSISPSTN